MNFLFVGILVNIVMNGTHYEIRKSDDNRIEAIDTCEKNQLGYN